MKRVLIEYNKSKREAEDFFKKTKEYFEEKSIEIVEDYENADFVVVIGGDGTLLRRSKKISKYKNIVVVAVNMGSLGFLTEVKKDEAFETYEKVLKGDFKTDNRRLLEVEIGDKIHYALNEVVASKGGILTQLVRVAVFAGDTFINTYRADGIIISTPTGSTAYSLSAGGPIIKPGLDMMLLTPIAPHNLTARPIVIHGEDEIRLRIEDLGRTGYLTVDGQKLIEICPDVEVKIRYSERKVSLVIPENRDYYGVLREKLKWGDSLC